MNTSVEPRPHGKRACSVPHRQGQAHVAFDKDFRTVYEFPLRTGGKGAGNERRQAGFQSVIPIN